jgi:hypothetical protein
MLEYSQSSPARLSDEDGMIVRACNPYQNEERAMFVNCVTKLRSFSSPSSPPPK